MKNRLSFKFLLPALLSVLLTAILSNVLVSSKIESLLTSGAEDKISSEINYITMISNEFMKEKISTAMNVLKTQCQNYGSAGIGNDIPFNDTAVPDLRFGSKSMVQDFSIVDEIKNSLGGTATLFVRQGNDYIRISTNIIGNDGKRAIGTKLNSSGKAYAAIKNGKSFYGVADILGNPYITAYEPICDITGNIIGVWYFGYPMSSLGSLERLIRKSKVLDDGFYTFVDNNNKVIFHSDNSTSEEVSGVLSGSDKNNDWVIRTADFSQSGYRIIAAYPRNNITTVIHSTQLKVVIIGIFITILLVGLLYYILTKIVMKPIAKLETAARKIALGNLSEEIANMGDDEIGQLAKAFNHMMETIKKQISYLDNLPAPVVLINRDFSVNYINKAGAALLGKEQTGITGKKCYELFKTGDCRTDNCACFKAMEFNGIYTKETTSVTQSREIPILYTGSPVHDKSGKVTGALEYITDITEIKELQNYLTRSTHALLEEMDRFASGELGAHVVSERDDEIGRLFNGFNTAVSKIRSMIIAVTEAIHATVSSSGEISASSEQIASGAQEQLSQTGSIAESIEQITKSILENTKNISSAADYARLASESTVSGSEKVKRTKSGMEKIVESTRQTGTKITSLSGKAEQIGEITQVIDEIADQTNLLALNAAIEAARAGEQGRGFAVVADEVRKLAERTTNATKEIADYIKQIQSETKEADASMSMTEKAVEEGMVLTEEVSSSLEQILQFNLRASGVVTDVAAASEQQSTAAEEISRSIEGISSVTQQSAAGTVQIAKAAEDLNQLTVRLQDLIGKFSLDQSDNIAAGRMGAGQKTLLQTKVKLN